MRDLAHAGHWRGCTSRKSTRVFRVKNALVHTCMPREAWVYAARVSRSTTPARWGRALHAPSRLRHSPSSTQRGSSTPEPRTLLLRLQLPRFRTRNWFRALPLPQRFVPVAPARLGPAKFIAQGADGAWGGASAPSWTRTSNLPGKNRLL